jgi:hypothetical protein
VHLKRRRCVSDGRRDSASSLAAGVPAGASRTAARCTSTYSPAVPAPAPACVRATSTAHASGRDAALRAHFGCVSARRLAQVQPGAGEVHARVAEVARGCARAAARAVQLGHGLRFRGELGFNSQQCDALLGSPCAAARNAGRACARAGVLAERASPRFHAKKRTCERGGTKLRNCTGFLGSCLHCPFSGPPGTWLRN